MTELSIGELDTLVFKAYRGAGFSWGMAQEAGFAARWLARHGLPAASYFDVLLRQIDGQDVKQLTPCIENHVWENNDRVLCPVVCGSVISDFGDLLVSKGTLQLGSVYSPAILLAFVTDRRVKRGLQMTVNDQTLSLSEEGAVKPDDLNILAVSTAQVTLAETSNTKTPAESPHQRAIISEQAMAYLGELAHRTYVPASEQSRTSGAGAGLTDND